jgi:hypothetical protein
VHLSGTWQSRTVFLVPDRFALTIITANEANQYLFDGQAVRAFVGARVVALDRSRDATLRTHARFTAVMNLDALRLLAYRVLADSRTRVFMVSSP